MKTLVNILRRSVPLGLIATFVAMLGLLAADSASAAVRFGAWNPGEPYNGSVAGANRLEAATGRRVEIVHFFQNWGADPYGSTVSPRAIRAVTDSGRTPLITWEPQQPGAGKAQPAYSLANIARGDYDAYITAYARGLRDLGSIVYLRPMHEMNGNWYPWGATVSGNTTAQFIAAWRHIHEIFEAQGAANVRWVWSPNNFDQPGLPSMESLYPGAAYVDVFGASGYNWGTARPEFGGWRSFNQIFRSVYDRLAALGPQPIWFTETATAPNGGDKPAWVRAMFQTVAATMPRLDAIIWFNEYKELDWRADVDPYVALAFNPDPAAAAALLAALKARGAAAAKLSGSSVKGFAGSSRFLTVTSTRKGRKATVRWRSTAAGRQKARQVRTWRVYLNGRRVLTMKAHTKKRQLSTRRLTRKGTHRWRIDGVDRFGRRILTAGKTFRVARF